jgi:hypothetical protein
VGEEEKRRRGEGEKRRRGEEEKGRVGEGERSEGGTHLTLSTSEVLCVTLCNQKGNRILQ